MEDFLQNLHIGNEPLIMRKTCFQYLLRNDFIGVGCSNKIHRNVGVNENHEDMLT